MSVKVAIVGLGKMGLLHASILKTLPNVHLVAVCDKKFWIRRFFKKVLKDVAIVAEVRELGHLDLDAVYVTTPVPSHYPIVKALYSARIASHIFVEKPLASSYEASAELCRLARGTPGTTMVGFNRRFAVTFLKAKEIVDEGLLGDVLSFKAYAYSSDFLGAESNLTQAKARGGVLRDLGCHAMDLALWFFGEMEVSSAQISPPAHPSGEHSVSCQLETATGAEGVLEASWIMEAYHLPEVGLQISGTLGTLSVNEDKVELVNASGHSRSWHRQDLNDQVPLFLGSADYFREDLAFLQAVVGSGLSIPDFESAAKVDRLIDQIRTKAGQHVIETDPARGR